MKLTDMINKVLLIFSLLLCFGCSTTPTIKDMGTQERYIELMPYLIKFSFLIKQKVQTKVYFVDLSDAAGLYYYSDDKIEIDIGEWQRSSYLQKEQLVFHELGHSIGRREHNDKIIYFYGDPCPESIMNSTQFSEEQAVKCYFPNEEYYYKELLSDYKKKSNIK